MDEIHQLCKTVNQLVRKKAWDEAVEAAANLWQTSRSVEIADLELRLTYAKTLIQVADLFYFRADDPYGTTLVLRRAYEFSANEEQDLISTPSLREVASYRLGHAFQPTLRCNPSSAFARSFRRKQRQDWTIFSPWII